ncbi:MAG: hypothetical protein NT106_09850, partial [Candidatus Sumerlaeota bacterium]|nr:hypothetical protein [Candidatus Sumerlaeota bacterium]
VVDHALWGVFITPGAHRVVCHFRPWSFIIGGILSLCTLLTLLIFLIYELRRRKWKTIEIPVPRLDIE